MSVQAQDRHPIRTATDQRGEQTFNRDSKTSGGVSNFASASTVLKWTLNRPSQAKNTNALKVMAGLRDKNHKYKHLRPSEIIRSEKKVRKIINVLTNEYINPFDISEDNSHLYNLSSGVPLPEEIAEKS